LNPLSKLDQSEIAFVIKLPESGQIVQRCSRIGQIGIWTGSGCCGIIEKKKTNRAKSSASWVRLSSDDRTLWKTDS